MTGNAAYRIRRAWLTLALFVLGLGLGHTRAD